MAVTKIHPIKTTLKKSIDYICNKDKTDEEVYVTTHLCTRELAHKEFEMTRKEFHSKTKTLAHHLIQSFMPGEVSFEKAHEVGKNLCDCIFNGEFEYVLATHIDKGHIHNHIIFNFKILFLLAQKNSRIIFLKKIPFAPCRAFNFF